MLLWVLEDNHRARKFYEKNGFIYSEVFFDDNIGGKNVREVLYFLLEPLMTKVTRFLGTDF